MKLSDSSIYTVQCEIEKIRHIEELLSPTEEDRNILTNKVLAIYLKRGQDISLVDDEY